MNLRDFSSKKQGFALILVISLVAVLSFLVTAFMARSIQVMTNLRGRVSIFNYSVLRHVPLYFRIVTLDAMGCQKKITKEIHEGDADYAIALKGNQETIHEEVKTFLNAEVLYYHDPKRKIPSSLLTLETVEKDHGRHEVRRYYLSAKIDWFQDKDQWENLRCFGMVESIRTVTGEAPSTERRFYLTSIPPDVRCLTTIRFAFTQL